MCVSMVLVWVLGSHTLTRLRFYTDIAYMSKLIRLPRPPDLPLTRLPPGPPPAPRHLVRHGQGGLEDQGGAAQDFPSGAAEPGEGAVAMPPTLDDAREERCGHAPGRRGAQACHAAHTERLAVSGAAGEGAEGVNEGEPC